MSIFFSSNMRFLRKKHGATQAQMIDILGFNRTTWNGYETGKSFPKFEDLIKIAEYFNISEADLIHKDISKGNLIMDGEAIEKQEKGNLKGNPIGNLNAEIDAFAGQIELYKQLLAAKDEIIRAKDQVIDKLSADLAGVSAEIERLKRDVVDIGKHMGSDSGAKRHKQVG